MPTWLDWLGTDDPAVHHLTGWDWWYWAAVLIVTAGAAVALRLILHYATDSYLSSRIRKGLIVGGVVATIVFYALAWNTTRHLPSWPWLLGYWVVIAGVIGWLCLAADDLDIPVWAMRVVIGVAIAGVLVVLGIDVLHRLAASVGIAVGGALILILCIPLAIGAVWVAMLIKQALERSVYRW